MTVANVWDLLTSGDAGPVARHASGVPVGGNLIGGLILEEHPHKEIPVFRAELLLLILF